MTTLEQLQEDRAYACDCEIVHDDKVALARAGMPDDNLVTDASDLFKMFGDSTRMRILLALRKSELCVCDLADALGMTISAVSHQLRLLKQAKLVKSRRDGKSAFYSLDDAHVMQIISCGIEHVSGCEPQQ